MTSEEVREVECNECWIPTKEANRSRFQKKIKHVIKKNRNLDNQGLFEVIGGAHNLVKDVESTKRIMATLRTIKERTKYDGSDIENLEENLMCRFEDIFMLVNGLSACTNTTTALSLIFLYIRTFYCHSVSGKIIELVSAVLKTTKDQVSRALGTDLDNQAEEEFEDTKFSFSKVVGLWKTHRECELAKQLANVVNILVTFNLIPDYEKNPLKCGDFTVFKAKAWDIQSNSLTFMDMVLDTATFFIERGYQAISSGDLTLLLYENREMEIYEKEYALLVSCLPLLEVGRLADFVTVDGIVDDKDYSLRVEKLLSQTYDLARTVKSPQIRTTLNNKSLILKKLQVKLIMLNKSSGLRIKPFGLLLFGGSAVGKSFINSLLLKTLLSANGFKSGKENIVNLNDGDKYQSEYETHHCAVTIDDFGNMKAEHYEKAPTDILIKILNNIPVAALSAEAHLKGLKMMCPYLFSVTTNVHHLMAATFTNEPASIRRRFEIKFVIRVKKECVDPATGGVNPAMMVGHCPDCWDIDMSYPKIIRRGEGKSDIVEDVIILKDGSLKDCLKASIEMSKVFFAAQRNFIKNVDDLFERELCEHSFYGPECDECLAQNIVPDEYLNNQADLETIHEESDEDIMRRIDASIGNSEAKAEVSYDEAVKNWYIDRGFDPEFKWINGAASSLKDAFAIHKDLILETSLKALGISATLYSAFKLFKRFRNMDSILEQGCEERPPDLLPTDVPNPWKQVVPSYIPKSVASRTTTIDDLVAKVSRSIGHATITDKIKGTRRKCDIIPLKGNVWLLPTHMLADHELEIKVQTTPVDVLGKNFTQLIDPLVCVDLGHDLSLVRLLNGGDVPALFKFLPLGDYNLTSKIIAKFVHRSEDGFINVDAVQLMNRRKFITQKGEIDGVDYSYPRPTFPGLCMGALISMQRAPTIMGFHLAGRNGQSYGAAGILTLPQFEEGMIILDQKYPLAAHSTSELITEKYGIDFTPDQPIPPRHAINFLTEDLETGQLPSVQVYGAHSGGVARFVSSVRKSPISDAVTSIMDIKKQHGKPSAFKINTHWNRDSTQIAHGKGLINPTVWDQARADVIATIDDFIDANPDQLALVHPYPKDYVLSGMDGVTSVDRLELTTSMGFPLNEAKNKHMSVIDRKVPGVTEAIDFNDDMFWQAVIDTEDILANEERCNTIFRANLKDEPVAPDKNKIRIFAGCEVSFTCLVRKYFLPIIRMIQSNWLTFECAVGINAHGREWDTLYKHMTEFGTDKMIAGDYKAFDKSATPLSVMTAFDYMIHIAERAGYTKRQLTIMRGVATECSSPIYEYAGILMKVDASLPSGIPPTVTVNGLQNITYVRYTYYDMYRDLPPLKIPRFNTRVKLCTYGDDNMGGVHPDEKRFNHTSVAASLAKIGITYTMADKEAKSVPYIDISQISFLKRGFIWNEDLEKWTAPLEVKSIAKSLHNYMFRRGSDVLPEQIAAQAIYNANMEFFYHGREVFEERREQLLEVAEVANVKTFVKTLPTYIDLIDRFNNGGVKADPLFEPSTLDMQCADVHFVSE